MFANYFEVKVCQWFGDKETKYIIDKFSRLPLNHETGHFMSLETLRNRTAGRLMMIEWSVWRDIFSSFYRPESSSRPVAQGPALLGSLRISGGKWNENVTLKLNFVLS